MSKSCPRDYKRVLAERNKKDPAKETRQSARLHQLPLVAERPLGWVSITGFLEFHQKREKQPYRDAVATHRLQDWNQVMQPMAG